MWIECLMDIPVSGRRCFVFIVLLLPLQTRRAAQSCNCHRCPRQGGRDAKRKSETTMHFIHSISHRLLLNNNPSLPIPPDCLPRRHHQRTPIQINLIKTNLPTNNIHPPRPLTFHAPAILQHILHRAHQHQIFIALGIRVRDDVMARGYVFPPCLPELQDFYCKPVLRPCPRVPPGGGKVIPSRPWKVLRPIMRVASGVKKSA